MTINHLNLVVPDVEATANFFIKHFDFLPQESRVKYVAILKSKDGFVLVISNFPNTTLYDYPKDFHIGFYQNDHQEIDQLFEKLISDVPELSRPRNIRDRYGFYFHAPGNISVEVTCPQTIEKL